MNSFRVTILMKTLWLYFHEVLFVFQQIIKWTLEILLNFFVFGSANPQIVTSKGYKEQPCHIYGDYPPPGFNPGRLSTPRVRA